MAEQKEPQEKSIGTITRRSMLKGTVALGAAAMTGSWALNMAAPGRAEAAPKKLPDSWDETWDVVIVGSGFAGMAAAAEAAGAGAKTVILEKMPTYGGNSIINGGVYAAWDSQFHYRQNLNLGDDSPELHAEDTIKGGDYYNLPDLVQVVAKGAAPALDWMISEGGARVRPTVTRAGGHSAYRTHTGVAGVGREFTDALRRIAEKRGAAIALNSEVTWIWRRDAYPQSPVLGLEVKRGRRTLNIRADRAVILASGGFSWDIKMRLAHNPRMVESFNCTNQPGATGEMIRFAQAVGADTLHMNFIQLYPFAEPKTGILDTPAVYPFNGPGYGIIYVSKAGKRFVNELERRDVCAFAQIHLGPDAKPTWSIFNEAMVLKMGGSNEEVAAGIEKGRFIKADTIAELAGKLNIPAAALQETVAKHNQYIDGGKDADFNKPMTKAMIPLAEGPFYGLAQWPAVHHTMGGIRIDDRARVIDIFGNPIPSLFAAGEVTGGVHGSNRLGSNAIPDAVSFGRVAGTNGAKAKTEA
ncbi:flavocytochrome c [Desulfatitalea alkaliphila]|uniref:Flavocytochrome c n=1 Tax=Desulfatitalea alkaliphila TaxID=2929485 RepID=A0AA41R2T0_9BACT|nr:flavocytochrome c [Desulfatitalea alkaliphila]MCJ8499880.1 flavocytochrome c [Desulfatitalea alkaliphila]